MMKKIIIFLLILAGCGSKGTFHDVELFCVDQTGSPVSGAKLKLNDEEKQADNQGRCVFQVPRNRKNSALPLVAEKDGYQFIGPKIINSRRGNPNKHIINFFHGYRLSFQTMKIKNKSDSSRYGNVAILLNDIPLGTTDEEGLLDTLLFEELDSTLNFIARSPSNEKRQKMEQWEWSNFYYPVKFIFTAQKEQKQQQQDYPITIVFQTYQQSNDKKESLAGIAISMGGTKIGTTDSKGRLEHRIMIHYIGEKKRFEARWGSLSKSEDIKFSDINRAYQCEFIFKKTISADKIEKAIAENKTINGWSYDPSYKLPTLSLANRKHFIFCEGKYEESCFISPDEKVGNVFNRIINFTVSNLTLDQLKLRKYSEPFQKLIDYLITFKGKTHTAKDLMDRKLQTTWYFAVKRDDGTYEFIDPNLSLKENGMNEGDIILIKDKP